MPIYIFFLFLLITDALMLMLRTCHNHLVSSAGLHFYCSFRGYPTKYYCGDGCVDIYWVLAQSGSPKHSMMWVGGMKPSRAENFSSGNPGTFNKHHTFLHSAGCRFKLLHCQNSCNSIQKKARADLAPPPRCPFTSVGESSIGRTWHRSVKRPMYIAICPTSPAKTPCQH